MTRDITFDLLYDPSSIESEVKVEIRAPTDYGARIAVSFHMTQGEFVKFAADGYKYFELNQASTICWARQWTETAKFFGVNVPEWETLDERTQEEFKKIQRVQEIQP